MKPSLKSSLKIATVLALWALVAVAFIAVADRGQPPPTSAPRNIVRLEPPPEAWGMLTPPKCPKCNAASYTMGNAAQAVSPPRYEWTCKSCGHSEFKP